MITSDRSLPATKPIRSVRVFLSSTFMDMQEERVELIRRVFPGVRERCEARGVNWGEVDLRWGVTEAEAEEGKALPICLAEVDECRPFFVAILGERYGWIPESIDPEVVERYPWLARAGGSSVTEIEIRHGALNDPSQAALFYFRDPSWLDRLPPGGDRSRYETPEPSARRRLADLKEEIRSAGYPARTYSDAPELGRMIREDLDRLIDRVLPDGPADAAGRDTSAQRALVDRLARAHVGRGDYIRRLDAHGSGFRGPSGLVVTGPTGSGKSSLLAAWVDRLGRDTRVIVPSRGPSWMPWLRQRPAEVFHLAHFAGASFESGDVPAMLRRLVGAMAERFGFRRDLPTNPAGLASAFGNALVRAASRAHVVLVLDGLDAIDRRAQGIDLAWLPDPIPDGVRVVGSAGPGPVFDALAGRSWAVLELDSIGREARRPFAESYLRENHRKKLDARHLDAIEAVEFTSNAQFLRTFLEELVAAARGIEDLPALIARYAGARDLEGLFDLMLDRLEAEHGDGRPGLVREALALLWASRHGLGDVEVRELLGPGPEDPLPSSAWIPLRHALRPFCNTWSGLVGLASPGLRTAVERRYLADPASRSGTIRMLADYFAARPVSARVVEELPWHLARLGDWSGLAERLADPSFLVAAWPVHRHEIGSYWAAVEDRTPFRMADALGPMVDAPPSAALAAAQLLADSGDRAGALRIARRITEQGTGPCEPSARLAALDLAASLALEAGELKVARTFSDGQENLARSVGDPIARIAALARIAAIERRLSPAGRDAGLRHLDEAERLAEAEGADDLVADLIGQRIRRFEAIGEPARGLALTPRRATIYRQLGDLAGLQDTLAQRGRLLARLRKSSAALAALDESEAIARRLRDPAALQSYLGDRAEILIARRRLDDALRVIAERERICDQDLYDPCARALAMLQRAELFGEAMKRTAIGLELVDRAAKLAAGSGCVEALYRVSAARAAILAAPLLGGA